MACPSPPLDLKLLDVGAFDSLLQSAASVSGGEGGVGLGIMPSLEEAECNGQMLGLSSSLWLEGAVALWRIRNERRRLDGIEGLVATTECLFIAKSQVLHYLGCHILWRVSTRVYEHLHLTDDKLKQLCECLNSPELRVKTLAAVTLWQLGLTRETLRRIPFDIAVRPPNAQTVVRGALLRTLAHLPAPHRYVLNSPHPSFLPYQIPALLDELLLEEKPSVHMEEEAGVEVPFVSQDEEGDTPPACTPLRSNAKRLSNRKFSDAKMRLKSDHVNILQELRCKATIGQPLNEVRRWTAGSLNALLEHSDARVEYEKAGGHVKLMRLFKQPDKASGEAATLIFLALTSRGNEGDQQEACSKMIDVGLHDFVKLATGRRPDGVGALVDWRGRILSAAALAYCISRTSARDMRARSRALSSPEAAEVGSVGGGKVMHFATLVGELRAGISMLLMPISLHVMAREAQRRSTRPFAEHALIMMGGLVCCMWGLAHPLYMTGQAITAPSALL
ncbi:MAG: hypothetical protein SGPRY_000736, partial [Prymnesium sp.]